MAVMAAALVSLLATPAAAVTVIVPDSFATIQQAIDSGANEILIRPGTYDELPVIATIPGNPAGWPEIDDLVIRGLVPAGTSLDSLPVIAGLVLETLAGGWTRNPSITLTDLKFSRPVENRFTDAPYSNPLEIVIARCVLGQGLDDENATVGGQLEYNISGCRIEGSLRLTHPQIFYLQASVVRSSVVLGPNSNSWYSAIDRVHVIGNRFEGGGESAIDISSWTDELEIKYNTFVGFRTPVRDARSVSVVIRGNTFVGPGLTPVQASPDAHWGQFDLNRISGFETGVLLIAEQGAIVAAGNVIENCGTAIRAEVEDNSLCSWNVIRSCSTGIVLSVGGRLSATGNVVQGCHGDGMALRTGSAVVDSNVVGHCNGDGIRLTTANRYGYASRLAANTSYKNVGAGLVLTANNPTLSVVADHNISYGNGGTGLEVSGPGLVETSCNDLASNAAGQVSGISAASTDLMLDPLFCDVAQGDVHLSALSPLLNAAGCGPIGALGQGCDAPIVSRLTTFTAASTIEGIEVRWQVADAAPGFVAWLERAEAEDGPWTRVECERVRDGDLTVEYDRTAAPARSYWYRLVATDRGMTRALGEPILAETAPPRRFALLGMGPNPSRGAIEASFQLAHAAEVTVEVFDAQGRRVATLASGSWPAGVHRATWAGAQPASGIYLVRYRYPGGEDLRRIAVVR